MRSDEPEPAHPGVRAARNRKRRLVWVALMVVGCGRARGLPAIQDGDIVFHTSRSAQSLAIQRATGSRYSHMGVVLSRGGKPYVFEAISTVQFTPLDRWIARGEGGHFVVKRLTNASRILTATGVAKLRSSAGRFEGRPYDLTFEWSDDRVYCSELVWKMYETALSIRIGELRRLREFDLTDPVVRNKMRERYGKKIPLDEPVISPAAMYESPLLETVVVR